MSNGRLTLLWTLWATALLSGADPAAGDVSGKWRFTIGNQPPTIVDVTDSAGVVSFTLLGVPFSGPNLTTLSAPASPPGLPCPSTAGGLLLAGQRHLRNTLLSTINPPTCSGVPVGAPLYADRCSCFDGNAADGDGCSAACQIEACFTCTGMPSVCTPSANGAACDDGRDCTGGETCSAGICGGGAALPNCTDISGTWLLHLSSPTLGESDTTAVYTQRNGYIEEAGGGVGEIDTATGDFSYWSPPFVGTPCVGPSVDGSVAADGMTLSAARNEPSALPSCIGELVSVTGTRCGNGTVDSGEACDDGDADNGDGCSAACALEPCWSCSGAPSVCAPADGGACDPDDACLTSGTCAAAPAAAGRRWSAPRA
jgi:cysteine-rich repeat protein